MKISKLLQKTLIIQLILFAIIAVTTSFISGWNLQQNLLAEYINKGVVITKSIAYYSQPDAFEKPCDRLQNVIDQFRNVSGVSYIFVYDAKKQVVVHTFPDEIAEAVLAVERKTNDSKEIKEQVQHLQFTTLGEITEISYPTLMQGGHIYVGMSHQIIENRINFAVSIQLLIIILLFIFIISITYFLIERLSKDLNKLIEGAEQVRARQFDTVINIKSKHEIGVLADTFNAMVTEIRNYAHHLQQSEERFRIITETINIPLIIVDECEGFILYANSPTATLFKTSMKELIEHKLVDLFVNKNEWENILNVFSDQGSLTSYETCFKSFDHQSLYVKLSLQLIILNNEQTLLIAVQDISDRKRAESFGSMAKQLEEKVTERTRELHDKNVTLTKLNQEKNELLGIVAHDLKNPLSAILGMSEDIEMAFDDMEREEVIELVKKIQMSSRQMFELITNLLDVNAIESGKINLTLKVLDILPIVEYLVMHYTEIAKLKNITVYFFCTQEKYVALTDPNIVRQTLDNVISNAVKYSPVNTNIYIQLVESNNIISCRVRDEGPGLGFADQQKLFGKFTRLTPRPTGKEHSTGLGLFIVKKLIDAVQGQVRCESTLGKGSIFTLEFPSAITNDYQQI